MGGFANNAPIVTDGLVFYVDAGNGNSYPGSGTTWSDLVGGNDGTFSATPTTDSANGGSIVFDGADDYCSIQETPTLQTSASGQFTATAWFKYDTATVTYPQIFWNRRTVIGVNSLDNDKIYSYTGGGFFNSTTNAIAGNIYHATVTYDNGSLKIYVNGSLQNSTTVTLESQSGYTPSIGASNSNSNYYNGNIFTVHQYNRALSASEILQNYNALKNRFV